MSTALVVQTTTLIQSVTTTRPSVVETQTIYAIPPRSVTENAGLGLSFLPLAIGLTILAISALYFRGRNRRGRSDGLAYFRPWALRSSTLILLTSVALTCIPLLEMGRLILGKNQELIPTTTATAGGVMLRLEAGQTAYCEPPGEIVTQTSMTTVSDMVIQVLISSELIYSGCSPAGIVRPTVVPDSWWLDLGGVTITEPIVRPEPPTTPTPTPTPTPNVPNNPSDPIVTQPGNNNGGGNQSPGDNQGSPIPDGSSNGGTGNSGNNNGNTGENNNDGNGNGNGGSNNNGGNNSPTIIVEIDSTPSASPTNAIGGAPTPGPIAPGSSPGTSTGGYRAIVYQISQTDYFIARVLPLLLAAFFGIPWKVVYHEAKTMEPFHRMASPAGLDVASAARLAYPSIFTPLLAMFHGDWFIVLSSLLEYGSLLVSPLASEAVALVLVGRCRPGVAGDCIAVATTENVVLRILQALLGVMALGLIVLLLMLRRKSSGVFADPRSLLGLAVLSQSSHTRQVVSQAASNGAGPTTQGMEKAMEGVSMKLDTLPFDPAYPSTERGIIVTNVPPIHGESESDGGSGLKDQLYYWRHKFMYFVDIAWLYLLLMGLIGFIAGLIILIVYYMRSSGTNAFETFMAGETFGVRFMFSFFGVIISVGWLMIFDTALLITPLYSLQTSEATPQDSILIPYVDNPYTCLPTSIRRSHFLLAIISFFSILSDFLPLLLANIPFDRTTTLTLHRVSTWLSVGIMSAMLVFLIVIGSLFVLRAPHLGSEYKLLMDSPFLSGLVVASNSPSLVDRLRGLSIVGPKERDERVIGMGLRLRLRVEKREPGKRRSAKRGVIDVVS